MIPGPGYEERLHSTQNRLDWALFQQPANVSELAEDLRRDGIAVVIPPRKNEEPHNFIYVDHDRKISAEAYRLGPDYTAEAVLRTLAEGHSRASDLSLQRTLSFAMDVQVLRSNGFNPNVPQPLSSVFSASPEPPEHQLDQSLGQRHRR